MLFPIHILKVRTHYIISFLIMSGSNIYRKNEYIMEYFKIKMFLVRVWFLKKLYQVLNGLKAAL